MRLRALIPPAVTALGLTGCATDVQVGKPTIDAELVAARAAGIVPGKSARADVHALLGEPWLANEPLGIEVYRLEGKQRNMAVVFAPYPVPLPSFSDKLQVYTLVSYDTEGSVSARASEYVQAAIPDQPTLVVHAGDLEFVHEKPDTLSVSLDHYLRALARHATAPACTLLVGCDGTRREESDDLEICFSAAGLHVDEGRRQGLLLARDVMPLRPPDSPEACRESGGRYGVFWGQPPEKCLYRLRPLRALALAPGRHTLRFSSGLFDRGLTAELDCEAGQVTVAELGGEFLRCIKPGQSAGRDRDRPEAAGSVALRPYSPDTDGERRVTVYQGEQWLFPPGSPAP